MSISFLKMWRGLARVSVMAAGLPLAAQDGTVPAWVSGSSPSGGNGSNIHAQAELVAPGIWKLHFGTPEKFTPVGFRVAPVDAKGLAQMPETQLPFDAKDVGFTVTGHGCDVTLPLSQGEKLYGFGLNTKIFEMSGRHVFVRPTDSPENDQGDSHAPAPFYVSTKGYGVFVDTGRYASFYIGVPKPADGSDKSSSGGSFAPTPATTSSERSMLADIPTAPGVDVYVIGGPTLVNAVQRYNLFSGGGCVPPLWGLGVVYRGSADFKDKDTLKLAQSFRDLHMPCDVWGLEPGWQSHAYSCSFVWNTGNYPDPAGFIQQMQAMGYHLNLWEHCFTNPQAPFYDQLKSRSGDQGVWGGLVPDFADPEVQKIFGDYHDQLLFSKGIDGVKLDECDAQPYTTNKWTFPETTKFPSGMDGELMHSMLGELYQQTLNAPLRARNVRTWSFVRDSQALAASLPFTVYSDSYTFDCYLRGLVKEGFGGLLWTPEVRDASSLEDLYRRLEMVIFSPQALINSWFMKLPAWEQINKDKSNHGEVMDNHEEVENTVRKLLDLRMSFIPYLYAAFNDYHQTGMPPIRALVMDYPNDPETYNVDNEFMFGPSVLVAPVMSGRGQAEIYLPAGLWHNFWTGETVDGGKRITVSPPLDQVPLFVKDNTLLPLADPVEHVDPTTCFKVTVNVYGSSPTPCALYEDDGVSYDFEKGTQNRVQLSWKGGAGAAQKSGSYAGPARYQISGWTVK